MNNLCIYHKNCADGFGAALAVYLSPLWGKDTEFVAAQYGDEPPDVTGKRVIIVDFSYPRDVLEKMHDEAVFLHVIDHHKTAKDALEGLDYAEFDLNRSGAMMAWESPVVNEIAVDVPELISYIQDRDLWQWKLEGSREVSAALASYPKKFDVWESFLWDGEVIASMKKEGEAILRYQQNEVTSKASAWRDNPIFETIGEFTVPVMNCTTLISEVCNELSRGYPFAAVWFETEGKRIYSLRSTTGTDVGAIAKQYGGGGHPAAAGFTIPVDKNIYLENHRREEQ